MTKEKDGCLSDCVAVYFDLPLNKVPFFVKYSDWRIRLERFFKRRGYRITPVKYKKHLLANKDCLYLVQGISPRMKKKRVEHMVIYKGTKKYFDCHKSQEFLRGKPLWIWLVEAI